MIYSLFLSRVVITIIFLVTIFILYTVYLIRKYQFIQDRKSEILECYRSFIKLYKGDKFFSKRDYFFWEKKYEHLRLIIIDYKFHIDKLIEISDRFNMLDILIKNYVNIVLLSKDYENVINYLHSIFKDGLSQIESRNNEYIETELKKFKEFFDNQGGNILTQKQREMIVVDEANNIALAGTGTDHILILSSKVGYILKKGLAKPEEILLLAFENKTKEELEEKIEKKFVVKFNVHTFHSLGVKVIGESEERKPLVSELSCDDILLQNTIEEFMRSRMKNQNFTNLLNKYFVFFLNPEENILDFSSREGYEEYLDSVQIRTLRGEKVKSIAELEIANFLYLNGVDYQYNREYNVDTSSKQYIADFYLPEYSIWLEHIDIDRECNTVPNIDRWEYLDSWYEKRKIHEENFTELLETYSYQHLEGNLVENLRAQLEVRGVSFKQISEEQVFERLEEFGEITSFVGLLIKFLKLYKSSIFTFPELRKKASEYPYSKRYLAFLDIFEIILDDYESVVADSKRIDFDDMINKATSHIQNRTYESGYKYILVDEFQDISQSRYRLLKALIDQKPITKTFCVGETWQPIYRFTCSDLSNMQKFDNYFVPAFTIGSR